MSRPRAKRLKISGVLQACSPMHVGGMDEDPLTDMPLARDGQGRLNVPGTSLTGALRSWVTERFDDLVTSGLFGYQPPRETESEEDQGWASFLTVEDAPVELPQELDVEVWDGIGIDRQWGSTAAQLKYDRAVLPKGSKIDLRMSLDVPHDDTGQSQTVVGHLVSALQAGEVQLGASKSRGMGRVRLVDCPTIVEEDWASRTGMLRILKGERDGDVSIETLKNKDVNTKPNVPGSLEIQIKWKPDGPLMVKSGQDGIAVDMVPMVSGCGDNEIAMVLPGSSLKGCLRNHAEMIIRTVLRDCEPPWLSLKNRNRHLEQLQLPLIATIFGDAKRDAKASSNRWSLPGTIGRGLLEVDTCFAKAPAFHRQQWEAVTTAENRTDVEAGSLSPLYESFSAANVFEGAETPAYFQQAFHVAVDRWTGGAAEHFLYTAIEPFGIEWDHICLTLRLGRRVPDDEQLPAISKC